jgi:hypothetical protein
MENKQNTELFKHLQSADKAEVLNAIKALRDGGKDSILELLTKIYLNNTDKEIEVAIYKIFCDLKNQESAATVIELINDTALNKARKMLISSCWQSRLNYILHLETFIDLVLTQPFEIAFEAFTVIENLETRVSANRKNELMAFIDAHMDECLDDNLVLADDLKGIIRQYEE